MREREGREREREREREKREERDLNNLKASIFPGTMTVKMHILES